MRQGLLALIAISCASFYLRAQTPAAPSSAPTKEGVVSLQTVVTTCQDGQKASKELEDKFGPRDKDIQTRRQELDQLNQQLQRSGNLMSQEKREQMTRELETKSRRLDRDMQDAREEFERAQQTLLQSITQRLIPLIQKYAKDNGYALVLDISNPNTPVVYAAASMDLTKQIIEFYDKNTATNPASTKSGAH